MLPQVLFLALLQMNPAHAAPPNSKAPAASKESPRAARAKPKPKVAPRTKPKPASKPTPKATPKPAPKPAPRTTPKTTPKPKANPSPRPTPKPRPTPSPSPRTSPKPQANPAPRSNPTPRANPTPSSNPRPANTQPRPSSNQGYRPATRPDNTGGPAATRQTNPGTYRPADNRAMGEGRPTPTAVRQPEHIRPDIGGRVQGGTHNFERHLRPAQAAPHRSQDHRYARPNPTHVSHHPHARYGAPHHHHYRPYYSRWYVHPWWRWCYSTTVVVGFGFSVHAWYDWWAPPHRAGWLWVPGYYHWGYWHPGHWRPAAIAPIHYVYVPGWWETETVYVEGYYRSEARSEWDWVEGYYLEDGVYVRGHWIPAEPGPDGYLWESGFWDGETWVDGFWRPEFRSDYYWISSFYDEDGVFHSGYWMPIEAQEGYVWIPGWFDGNGWEEGYWVRDEEVYEADIEAWEPAAGWDDGWEVGGGWGDGDVVQNDSPGAPGKPVARKESPLALPVVVPD